MNEVALPWFLNLSEFRPPAQASVTNNSDCSYRSGGDHGVGSKAARLRVVKFWSSLANLT